MGHEMLNVTTVWPNNWLTCSCISYLFCQFVMHYWICCQYWFKWYIIHCISQLLYCEWIYSNDMLFNLLCKSYVCYQSFSSNSIGQALCSHCVTDVVPAEIWPSPAGFSHTARLSIILIYPTAAVYVLSEAVSILKGKSFNCIICIYSWQVTSCSCTNGNCALLEVKAGVAQCCYSEPLPRWVNMNTVWIRPDVTSYLQCFLLVMTNSCPISHGSSHLQPVCEVCISSQKA